MQFEASDMEVFDLFLTCGFLSLAFCVVGVITKSMPSLVKRAWKMLE
jgi:hypothetical protein